MHFVLLVEGLETLHKPAGGLQGVHKYIWECFCPAKLQNFSNSNIFLHLFSSLNMNISNYFKG